ncbi:MAG: hypothetical protein M0P69_00140 [Bacteroidales bacterium]|jgi:hypothetical protein|nr:hypothetical protein [Bacteroidales bacterium]
MKWFSILLLLTVILFACDKPELPVVEEKPLPVGSWSIVSVDSGYFVETGSFPEKYYLLKSMNLRGKVAFEDNNTGSWGEGLESITCGLSNFNWAHHETPGAIYFNSSDHHSRGIVRTMEKDLLIVDYIKWCDSVGVVGNRIAYRITAIPDAGDQEELPDNEENPRPVGSWSIVSVDSGSIDATGRYPERYFVLGSMNLKGMVAFEEHTTGFWGEGLDIINCGLPDFNWVHNDSLGMIYFISSDHLSRGIVRIMEKDVLILDYLKWCNTVDLMGGRIAYRITAVKLDGEDQ